MFEIWHAYLSYNHNRCDILQTKKKYNKETPPQKNLYNTEINYRTPTLHEKARKLRLASNSWEEYNLYQQPVET